MVAQISKTVATTRTLISTLKLVTTYVLVVAQISKTVVTTRTLISSLKLVTKLIF